MFKIILIFGLFSFAQFDLIWNPEEGFKKYEDMHHIEPKAQTNWGSWSYWERCPCGEHAVG